MKSIICVFISLFSLHLSAAEVAVSQAYLRATPPGTIMSSAFMQLTNNSDQNIRIIGGASDDALSIEIHNHAMINGVMSMQHIKELTIAPSETIKLAPGGLNFMLIGLQRSLYPGDSFSFYILFDNGQRQRLTLPIKAIVN